MTLEFSTPSSALVASSKVESIEPSSITIISNAG